MYFTNISDTELTQYHNQVETHFTRTLKTITDETEPNLFKIEEITDDILKIYPMFYCREITSSNPNDRILDNKCVICENIEDTKFTFISSTEDSILVEDIGFISGLNWLMEVYNPTFIVYNKKNGRLLDNVKVNVKLIGSDDSIYSDEGYSNGDGLVYLPKIRHPQRKIKGYSITIEYNGKNCIYEINNASIIYKGKTINSNVSYSDDVIGTDIELVFDDGTVVEYVNKSSFFHQMKDGWHSISFNGVVTGLGDYCFDNYHDLISVDLPNIESLGYRCFYQCTNLVSVSLSDTLSSIGNECFWNCGNLEVINLYWETSDDIIPYNWRWYIHNGAKIIIPQGTMTLYENKGYSSDKLIERSE